MTQSAHKYSVPSVWKAGRDLRARRLVSFSRLRPARRQAAFTLLELLVVIAIIGILSGMLTGGVVVVRNAAKKKQARTEAVSIVMAMKKYRGDFFQWPGQTKRNSDKDGVFDSDSEIAGVLGPLLDNPRKVNYIEIPEASYTNGTYTDPWGSPYIIGIDYSSDNVVKLDLGNYVTNVLDTVAVISVGQNPDEPGKGVFSW